MLDQFVGQVTPEELDAGVRRVKKAIIQQARRLNGRTIWAMRWVAPPKT